MVSGAERGFGQIVKSNLSWTFSWCFLFVDLKLSRVKQTYSPSQQFWNSLHQEVAYSCICILFVKCSYYQLHKFLYQIRSNQQTLLRLGYQTSLKINMSEKISWKLEFYKWTEYTLKRNSDHGDRKRCFLGEKALVRLMKML